jgi:hypothetical protein
MSKAYKVLFQLCHKPLDLSGGSGMETLPRRKWGRHPIRLRSYLTGAEKKWTSPSVIAQVRFSGHGRPAAWIAADVIRFEDGKLAEHWDVLQDEATQAESVSGLPMFGDRFPA